MMYLLVILLIAILIYFYYKNEKFTAESVDDILSYTGGSSDLLTKQQIELIKDPIKEIRLDPYGCFTDLEEKFFYKKINPYSKFKIFDSGIILNKLNDYTALVDQVKNNGFEDYANTIIKKYPVLSDMSLQEISVLALFSGYSYISIYKESENTPGKIYLTYSPPMNKHNIQGWFSDKEYKKHLSKSDLPNYKLVGSSSSDLVCGFPCEKDIGYMCGSANYPNIKTSTRFAVYHIVKTI